MVLFFTYSALYGFMLFSDRITVDGLLADTDLAMEILGITFVRKGPFATAFFKLSAWDYQGISRIRIYSFLPEKNGNTCTDLGFAKFWLASQNFCAEVGTVVTKVGFQHVFRYVATYLIINVLFVQRFFVHG